MRLYFNFKNSVQKTKTVVQCVNMLVVALLSRGKYMTGTT